MGNGRCLKVDLYKFGNGLVNFQLHHLDLVFATTIAVGDGHATFSTLIRIGFTPFNSIQFIHAVMHRNYKACADYKINQE